MKKSMISLVVIVMLLFVFISQLFAYSLFPAKWPGTPTITVTYRWNTANAPVKSMWTAAKSNWNGSQSKINLSYNASGTNSFGAEYIVSNTRYGDNYMSFSGENIVSFDAYINTGNPDIYDGNYDYTVGQSAGAHEIGHGIGVLNELTSGTAIMNVNRDRSVIYQAQTDDINGINAQYQ